MEKTKQSNILTYSGKEKVAYLTGMAGQNMLYAIISTACVGFYLQNVIFIPAMAVSIITAIARVWDALNDPMMGTFVDKTRTKWGKCRPYLIFAPVVIMLSTILCFVNGRYSDANSTIQNVFIIGWCAISYIAWGMLYTVGDIPLWGLPGLMTNQEKDRSSLLSLARIVAAAGGALGFVAIPAAQALAGEGASAGKLQWSFIIVAIVLTVVGSILFQVTGLACKERVIQSEKTYTMKENFQLMWRNKPYRRLLISGIIRSPFMLLMLIAMPLLSYYFTNNQGITSFTIIIYYALLGGGIFGGQLITSAIAPKLAEKYQKVRVYNISSVASGIGFALIFVIFMIAPAKLTSWVWLILLALCFVVAGAGMGAINVLQSLLIADCVDYEEYHNHIRPDGVFFSGQSFITKLSSGVASIVMGIVFTIVGYSGDNIKNLNTSLADGVMDFKTDAYKYSWAMFFLCAIPPAIGLILSIIPMKNYEITDQAHAQMLEELRERRAKEAEEKEMAENQANLDSTTDLAQADTDVVENVVEVMENNVETNNSEDTTKDESETGKKE